jgi:hypothetical protein
MLTKHHHLHQTVSEMVLVMEYVPCGDLWSLMHPIDEGGIDVDSTKSLIFPTKFLSFNSKTRSVVTPVRDDGVPRSARMKSPGGLGQCLDYFIIGLLCYIRSFLLFVWLFFFTYALL